MRGDRTAARTAVVGVLSVALTAAVISFFHVRDIALEAGESELVAWLLPISIDGAIAAAAAVILADSRAGRRPGLLTWLFLVLGLCASLAANVASAEPTLTARAVAIWPPIALALGIEVLSSLARRTGDQLPAAAPAPAAPAPAAPTARPEPAHAVPAAVSPASGPDRVPDAGRPARVPVRRVPGAGVPGLEVPVAVPARAGASDPRVRVPVTGPAHRRAGADRPATPADQAAIEEIRRLDAAAPSGVAARKDIEKALGCGGSRAARLAGLARE